MDDESPSAIRPALAALRAGAEEWTRAALESLEDAVGAAALSRADRITVDRDWGTGALKAIHAHRGIAASYKKIASCRATDQLGAIDASLLPSALPFQIEDGRLLAYETNGGDVPILAAEAPTKGRISPPAQAEGWLSGLRVRNGELAGVLEDGEAAAVSTSSESSAHEALESARVLVPLGSGIAGAVASAQAEDWRRLR